MKKVTQPTTIYKLRNAEGKFSCGKSYPRFTKQGKAWANIGHIKNHLKMFEIIPNDWEVIEYQLVEIKNIKALDLNPKAVSPEEKDIKDIIE
jgi:hypothetical protein